MVFFLGTVHVDLKDSAVDMSWVDTYSHLEHLQLKITKQSTIEQTNPWTSTLIITKPELEITKEIQQAFKGNRKESSPPYQSIVLARDEREEHHPVLLAVCPVEFSVSPHPLAPWLTPSSSPSSLFAFHFLTVFL